MDVRESAKKIKTPTLVLQAKDDATVAYEIGRETATYIPGACFVILESNNHVLLSTEPACPHFGVSFIISWELKLNQLLVKNRLQI
jgi:pimeloyl-ACP methyl ester carboxylesterase